MEDKNEQYDFEKHFKNQLGDMETPPSPFGLKNAPPDSEEALDQLFQKGFQDFESTPAPKIWNNIEEHLPLHLMWRRRLIRLSQVAAVLLIVAFCSVLFTQSSSPLHDLMYSQKETVIKNTESESTSLPTLETDFVYQLEDDNDQKENSKMLFPEDVKAARAMRQKKRELQNYVEHFGDLEPLATSPIEELNKVSDDEGLLTGDKLRSTLIPSISIPTATLEETEEQTNKDILANQNTPPTSGQ